MLIACVSLLASVWVGHHSRIALSIALVCLAMGGALSHDGPFWAAASTTVPAALLGRALGNLGGFVGPSVGGYLQDASGGSFVSTTAFFGVMLLLAGPAPLVPADG